jgi:hypothetical protein
MNQWTQESIFRADGDHTLFLKPPGESRFEDGLASLRTGLMKDESKRRELAKDYIEFRLIRLNT